MELAALHRRAGPRKHDRVLERRPERAVVRSAAEVRRGGREEVAAVERTRVRLQAEALLLYRHRAGQYALLEKGRKDAVIRADEVITRGRQRQRAAPGTDARVHDDEVNGPGGEISRRGLDYQRGREDLVGRDVVADVDQAGARAEFQQHALHTGHVAVGQAKVARERNDGLSGAGVRHFGLPAARAGPPRGA
jgi:hypothetical protein